VRPIDRSLLQIFSSEQAEHIGRVRDLLAAISRSEAAVDPAVFDELLRRAHTLKGAAHAVALEPTEILTHLLETVLLKIQRGEAAFAPDHLSLIEQTLETIEDILAAALAEKELPDIREVRARLESFPKAALPHPASTTTTTAPVAELSNAPSSDLMRVNADRIDSLVRSSSQLLVTTVRDGEGANPFVENARYLDQVQEEWVQLRRKRFSGYNDGTASELQRANTSLNYIDHRLDLIRLRAHQAAALWEQKSKEIRQQAEELYDSACSVRMTPADTVFSGLGPLMRELAHRENKQVEFRAEGLETQADRVVLQALKDPVLQVLRNAVSHGAETADERAARGTSPVNTVLMRVHSRGDRLNLTIQDDGKGINEKAIMEEAAKRGLASTDPAKLLMVAGLSTAKQITSVSGRGVGLSIVQEAVARLQGNVSIRPAVGGGTTISISVPLAMSTQHILFVRAATQTFGISTSYIDRLVRADKSDIQLIEGRESIVSESEAIPLLRLTDLLSLGAAHSLDEQKLYVVVITLNDDRFGIVVDSLQDERDSIIKESGLSAAHAGMSTGVIPMDDGTVAVVLNIPALVSNREHRKNTSSFLRAKQEQKTSSILVVDDSLTTRSLEKSILESQGYRVRVAVDGEHALEQIRAEAPDMVISDVMMPRLTGFELLAEMKADPAMKKIPVILVTSLESREEQARGLELGADAYIVKQRFDQRELMRIVRQIL
jgi:two-component system chemotaxis sensor kinase CheA